MIYRDLGASGISVSVIGLGTVKLGRDEGVSYPEPFTVPDQRQARRLLDTAAELGINLLDTAPAYGPSEQRLGGLLRSQRKQWVVCTKVGESFAQGRSSYDFTPEHVRHSVKRSLQRIHTDYLDVVLIHSDGNDIDILERSGALDCLRDLQNRGWIRAVGISHKSIEGARCAIDLHCDVLMATLNIDTTREAPVIAQAGAAGCGVLVKKALASGHAAPASLQFAASQPGVSAVLVGTIQPQHLREDVAAVLADPASG